VLVPFVFPEGIIVGVGFFVFDVGIVFGHGVPADFEGGVGVEGIRGAIRWVAGRGVLGPEAVDGEVAFPVGLGADASGVSGGCFTETWCPGVGIDVDDVCCCFGL